MASTQNLLKLPSLSTGKRVFGNEAVIAVLSSSLLSPLLVPTITKYVNMIPVISNHASIAAIVPAILLFRIGMRTQNRLLGAAIIGVSGSFVLTAIMPIVSPLINRVRS